MLVFSPPNSVSNRCHYDCTVKGQSILQPSASSRQRLALVDSAYTSSEYPLNILHPHQLIRPPPHHGQCGGEQILDLEPSCHRSPSDEPWLYFIIPQMA